MINSNRWASRPLSQRIHRKDWTPPSLPERRSAADEILHYSMQDYVVGESSQGMLRRIALRLNHGTSSAQTPPELDLLDSESRPGSVAVELHADSLVELEGSIPSNFPTQQAERARGETIRGKYPEEKGRGYLFGSVKEPQDPHANRTRGEATDGKYPEEKGKGHLFGRVKEPQDWDANREHDSPRVARQVRTMDKKMEGGFF